MSQFSFLRETSTTTTIRGVCPATLAVLLAVSWAITSCAGISLDRQRMTNEIAARGRLACYPPETADPAEPVDPIDATDLVGTWAQVQITTSVSSAPIVGDITTTNTAVLRLEANDSDGEVTFRSRVCSVNASNVPDSVRTTIPAAFVAAIPEVLRPVLVDLTDIGQRVYFPPVVELIGLDLENPGADIPSDGDDPHIVDGDRDGNPGLSVNIEGMISGQIYVVQRAEKELCGYLTSPDTIDGAVSWQMERVVVGASSFLLNRQTDSTPHPDFALNQFRTTRIDAAMTCDDIVAQAEALFSREL